MTELPRGWLARSIEWARQYADDHPEQMAELRNFDFARPTPSKEK